MRNIFLSVIIFFCISCQSDSSRNHIGNQPDYFDLKGYFTTEAKRIQQQNPLVIKTVGTDRLTETKKINIGNWEQEFSSFISTDINKASWSGEFTVHKSKDRESYTTENEKIAIKAIEIERNNEKITKIKIIRFQQNSLYISSDTLIYIPDSLYFIKNYQKIKFMKERNYEVKGLFR